MQIDGTYDRLVSIGKDLHCSQPHKAHSMSELPNYQLKQLTEQAFHLLSP